MHAGLRGPRLGPADRSRCAWRRRMPDPATERKHLERLNALISEAEARLAEQRKLIDDLERDGHATDLARRLLVAMEGNLKALRDIRQVGEGILRDSEM